ncbi:PA3496 family putative envelope integrity protein [Pseudomaricurvus sp.]|uniref:PA3496 family putative envelope integrity protein n=1 Tax=Pseudomaricurvus sp. TaxID=2004510 RepID=UPI003F6B69A1
MSKTRSSHDDELFESDGDFECEIRETHYERREKNRRQTAIRRRMEDKLERRRMSEQLGMYLDDHDLDDGCPDELLYDRPSYSREFRG